MARRRYGKPSPVISTAGQAAQPRDPSGDESLSQPIEPRSEYCKPPPEATTEPASEPQHFQTGLKSQLDAQRQRQQFDALDAYISAHFPGATPNERAALGANQVWLANPGLVHAAGRIALERGVPRESREFLQAIGALIDQHLAAMMQAQPAPSPPMPAMPPMPPPVMHHVDLEKVESPEGEPEAESVSVHHVSAPVSRGEASHAMSGDPQLTPSQVRLTPEERELCQMNKIDETQYAAGKLKLAKQKAAKLRD
jgi:hypothetical protein